MRRFHERYGLLLMPGVTVPAFAARAPHEWVLSLDWTPFTYPLI